MSVKFRDEFDILINWRTILADLCKFKDKFDDLLHKKNTNEAFYRKTYINKINIIMNHH